MEVVTEKPTKNTAPEGYKRTKMGVIPEGWETFSLGDLLTVMHGKSQKAVESEVGEYPILGTSGQIGKSTEYLYDKPSVLIGRKGTIDNPQYKEEPFWTIDTLFYTIVNEKAIAKYLYYKFLLVDWKSHNEASGVPSLNSSTIEDIEIELPTNLQEQRAIAEALSDVDALIAELDALIDKKQQVKKGAMQQLLTGKKRLPGFSGEWEEKSLGEVLYVQGGYAFKSVSFQKFGIPIIRISNIQDGSISLEESTYYSPEMNIPNEFKIKKDEALIAMSGATTGKVGLYEHENPAYQNQRVGKFVVNDSSKTDNSYILHLVNSDLFRRVLSKELEQGAQPNVSGKQLEGLEFDMASDISEQKAIAGILSDMDAEIQALESKREKYKQIKQGMMQGLLMGKTRLV